MEVSSKYFLKLGLIVSHSPFGRLLKVGCGTQPVVEFYELMEYRKTKKLFQLAQVLNISNHGWGTTHKRSGFVWKIKKLKLFVKNEIQRKNYKKTVMRFWDSKILCISTE